MINTHSLCAHPERGGHTKGVLSAGNQICQRPCVVGTEGYINPPASGALGYPADTKDCGKNYEYKSVNVWHFFLLCTANIHKLSIMTIIFSLCLIKKLFSQRLRAVCILYPDAIPFFSISHPVSPQLCYLFTRSSPIPELLFTLEVYGWCLKH